MMKKLSELIEKTDDKNPIKEAYKKKHRYYDDFISLMKRFESVLSKKEYKELVSKFQFEKEFNQQQYLQVVSEITILDYILRHYNSESKFIYEPKYNGGYNPECSFIHEDKTINVEVKCPNLEKRLECESRRILKIFPAERIENHSEVINTLVDMIIPNLEESEYEGIEEKKG